ncbi:MAG: helicase-exonuclease AddAB subunit AddB [Eubacteriales bacterium]|nr:helicase-exonuclease AddAB subunit AddB [Eubacteriales bacterium]
MSLRFVTGASGAGKSTYIYEEIIRRSRQEPNGRFLILVPDQFTMQTQLDLVTMHEKKGILNIDVLSFGRLTHRIFEELGGEELPMLDDTGKSLIIRRVAAGLEGKLPVLGGNLGRTGYIHEVKSALSEFMQYGVGLKELDELTEFSRKRGQLYYKLRDLRTVYEGFQQFIREKYLTTEESLEVLAALLPASRLIQDSVIVFDGFTGFTPVQNKVIAVLLRCAREVIVTVTLGDGEDPWQPVREQELFAMSRKLMQSLAELAHREGVDIGEETALRPKCPPRFQKSPELAHLERSLFRYPVRPFGERPGDGIRLMEASTRREEVRQICIAIKRLTEREDYCYRDIAVICGDYEAYASCIEQEFAAYGIPVYLDQTRSVTLNPFIEYIKSALQVRVKNYSYEAVFHYLRSGLADFTPRETDRLEVYVRALGIRGRKKWETLFVYPTGDMADPAAELAELNGLRQRLVEQLEPLYGNYRKTGEFARGLYDFIAKNQVQQKLKGFERRFEEQGDAVYAREYAQIYRLVMDLLDQIVSLIGEEPSRPEEFARILEAGFEELQVGTIPQNVDRVVAGDMERTRLKQVKALFFAGVNDGNIPKNAGKGGIISDLEREFLTGSGLELAPSPRQQMYIQRLYLYLNMTKPSQLLTLSWARMDGEGKALRRSFLIGHVQRLFPQLSAERPENEGMLEQVQSFCDGREYLASGLRRFADGLLDKGQEREFLTLYRLYRREELYRVWTGQLTDTAFFSYREPSLGRVVAAALYGQTLSGSVSRLEQFSACAYAHFLRYGMKLKEQEEFSFEAVDLGNIFHGVLEIFADKLKEIGKSWFDFSKEEGERLVDEAVEAYAVSYHNTVLYDSARNAYMVKRIKRILKRTVAAMQYQLKKGSFVPEQFEVSFSVLEELDAVNIALSEQEKMRLRGRIDRMDVREDREHVYVKVLDYKSGSRDFSLAALYYGLQLQLVVYMNAAMEIAGKKHPDKQVVPAAMLYYRVQDPMVELPEKEASPEEINRQVMRALRATGVVNARDEVVEGLDSGLAGRSDVIPVERKKDGSFSARSSLLSETDFRAVSAFVDRKIRQAGRQILDGRISLDPYEQANKSACDFCPYKKVCGFDKRIGGFAMRELENLKDEEALLRIREETADGNEIHT